MRWRPRFAALTVVTNQAIYVQGDYNATDKKPAAFLADSLNILSGALERRGDPENNLANRVASNTTIQAAFLAGTDTTGGVEGAGGQGLVPTMAASRTTRGCHEDWSGRHADVSRLVRQPQHAASRRRPVGRSEGRFTTPPNRDWDYDTDFNNAANLPPLSPRFTHLRQELFQRQFERT